MENRLPYAHRPLRQLYLAIYPLVENDRYINMKKEDFIKEAIKNSSGTANPEHIESIYNSLISEAGLGPKL